MSENVRLRENADTLKILDSLSRGIITALKAQFDRATSALDDEKPLNSLKEVFTSTVYAGKQVKDAIARFNAFLK